MQLYIIHYFMSDEVDKNTRLYNIYFALQGSFYTLIQIHIIAFFVGLLIFVNQGYSTKKLENLQSNDTLPVKFAPSTYLELKLPVGDSCPLGFSFSSRFNYKWPGTKNGIDVKQFTYKYDCNAYCLAQSSLDGYESFNCRTSPNACCDFKINTINKEQCKSNGLCFCPEVLSPYSNTPINSDITSRGYKLFDSIPELSYDSFKICERQVQTQAKFYDSKCENGIYCFNTVCLRGVNECPDYSSVFSIKINSLISDASFLINSIPCTFMDNGGESKEIDFESTHILSNSVNFQRQGCKQAPIDSNIVVLKSIKKQSILSDEINIKIKEIDDNSSYSPKYMDVLSKDNITFYAKSHYALTDKDECINKRFEVKTKGNDLSVIDNLDLALTESSVMIQTTKEISAWFAFDIIFLILRVVVVVYLFTVTKSAHLYYRFVIQLRFIFYMNLSKMIFSGIKYGLIFKSNFLNDIIDNLDASSKLSCFSNFAFNIYLQDLSDSMSQFVTMYSSSTMKMFAMDSAVFVLISVVSMTLIGFKVLIGIKKIDSI